MLINKFGIKMAMPSLALASLASLVLSFFLRSPQWFLDEQKEREKKASIDAGGYRCAELRTEEVECVTKVIDLSLTAHPSDSQLKNKSS